MIRRHAYWFRALLIAADALLAVGLLVVLSFWRFGPDWSEWWREIVPLPGAFLLLYAGTWVAVLTLNGLYRPRARWTLRSEAIAIVRATVVMALVTLSVLFLFRLPEVSRLLLLVLFPAQAVATIVERALLRLVLERYRRRGNNLRFVLVLGAGPRGPGVRRQARGPSRARPARHRLPRLRSRRRDERSLAAAGFARRARDRPAHPCRRRGRDLPPVLAVGPDRRHRGPVRGGGQDRPDPDGRHGPGDVRGPRRGARRDAGVLAGLGPGSHARPGRQARTRPPGRHRRPRDPVAGARRDRRRDRARRRPAGPVPPDPHRPPRAAVHGRQVPLDGGRRRGAPRRARRSQRPQRAGVQAGRATRGSPESVASCGARRSTSCRSCGTCSAAR